MSDDYEETLKLAALNKLKKVNHLINEITIGPKSLRNLNIQSPASPKPSIENSTSKEESSNKYPKNELPTRQFLQILELERQEKVKNALNARVGIFERFQKNQEDEGRQAWLKRQQAFIQDMERQERNIIQANQQYDLNQSLQHEKMAQQTQNAIQRIKQKQEELREKEKQRQLLTEYINIINLNQQKFTSEYQQILGILKSCIDNDELKNSKEIDFNLLKTLPAEIESVVNKCKPDSVLKVSEQDAQMSHKIVETISSFKHTFKLIVENINKKKQEALKVAQEPPKPTQVQSTVPPPEINLPASAPTSKPNIVGPSPSTDAALNLNKLAKYVSISNLQNYTELMEFYDQFKQSFKGLESDASLKNFKFDCKKAINIPVNSISGVNSQHIMDKYTKLFRLLSGQSVIISNKEINAARHPEGIPFCMDLLAKKLVLQGDLMVSSNPESAFCYASVILSLWNDFPDLGKLIQVHFYKTCPYSVPYVFPRSIDQTDEEFYKNRGYQYTDGEVEKQDKFLKRMTGILKLYFSLLVSKPKRGQNSSPHDLKVAWRWLASFLRLEPQIDITATALHVFLETVGFKLDATYGKMFQKVLNGVLQVFLPKCKEIKSTGGSMARLELLMAEYIKNGKFEAPNGFVNDFFF